MTDEAKQADVPPRTPPSLLRTWVIRVNISVAVWIALTVAFFYWIQYEVNEEFRLGTRTSEQGDAVMIPIAGFAILLLKAIIVANVIIYVAELLLRRRRAAFVRAR